MKLAIFNKGIPYNGRTPFEQPLGGSESGIVYIAREFAALGCDVTVYCNCPEPGTYDGVRYANYRDLYKEYAARWDVFITFRSYEPLMIGRLAPRMVFWSGDDCDQPYLENLNHPSLQTNLDLMFCVSEWHRRRFIDVFGVNPDKIVATRNGFAAELVPSDVPKNWTHAAYSSTPFRGLEILLSKIFPDLRSRIPEMTLDVFSSMKVYRWSGDEDQARYGHIYQLVRQPGVNWAGSVAQPVLMRALAQAGFLLYPNIFDETSCIAAIEAQANGAVVVTSARAGLNETVEDQVTGICLKGDPATEQYQVEFIETVCALLNNRERLLELSENARRRAFQRYTWRTIAQEWTELFKTMPTKAVHGRYDGPVFALEKAKAYWRAGNVAAMRRALSTIEHTPFYRAEIEELRRAAMVEEVTQ